ncbi:MAG TPA: GAF domain-containing sensor histidine kinase [Mycobacteriales bacterium]|nr:GAF domain-containing sensor histidine kinase [Mycobacteriales bacterium]
MSRPGVVGSEALFEDPHTDGRMRALIPRFAFLGAAAYVVVAGLASRSATELVALGVVLVVTLALTVLLARGTVLSRVSRRTVFVVLVTYAALIAVPTTDHDAVLLLDEILQVLAVLFGAVFFAGWARFGTPLSIAVVVHLVLTAGGKGSWGELGAHVAGYVLVGYFGSEVASTLRESLRANRAIHSVLEAATGELAEEDIAAIGLRAALVVSRFEAGAVTLADGEALRVVATSGFPEVVVDDLPPLRVDGPGLSAAVVRSGEPLYVEEAGELLGAEQAVMRWGARCLAGVPVRYHGEVIGTVTLCHRSPRGFADADRHRVAQVAEQLGLALGNARAYRREAAVAARLLDLNRRKDEFLANVSHELRTPATSLGLAARTLHAGRGRLTEEQEARIVEMMRRRSAELTGLIEALLAETVAASGQTRLETQPVDWAEALPRWVAAAEDVTGRHVDLELPDAPVVSFADPAKCERIVGNLLSNATKFSEPDTPVTCRLDADADAVRVTVTDRGVGIAEHVLPHVFDRFFQGDGSSTRAHGGLGIGLSLVRHFAQAHGGSVDIASTEGVGTTVTVTLPRDVAGAAPRLSVVPPLGA